MGRLRALRLAPCHTQYYKKLDQFGKIHDAAIKQNVGEEINRLNAVYCTKKESIKDQVSEDDELKVSDNIPASTKKPVAEPSVVMENHAVFAKIGQSLASIKNIETKVQSVNEEAIVLQKKMLDLHKTTKSTEVETVVDSAEYRSSDNVLVSADKLDSSALSDSVEARAKEAVQKSNNFTLVTPDFGRKIVLDNIDYHQETHNMTENFKDPDLHYCTYMATENRVSGNHLTDEKPIGDLMEMENGKCCPDRIEHAKQRSNYITLVSCYITSEIPCLEFLKDAAQMHIPHMYSAIMKQQTQTVRFTMMILFKPKF